MSYCEETDLLHRIKKAEYDKLVESDDENIESADILAEAIADADSVINGYLKNVVAELPLVTVPESIRRCSVDITIFNLHARIQYADIPQFWKDKYDAAIAFLRDISKGYAGLDQQVAEDDTTPQVNVEQETRQFGRGTF